MKALFISWHQFSWFVQNAESRVFLIRGFKHYRQQSMGNLDFVISNNQWEIRISLQATINGKFGFRYRQQSMGNLDFATGNNQREIWISLQVTINGKFRFRYRQQLMENLDFVTGNN